MKGRITFSILFSLALLLCLNCASNQKTSFNSDELEIAIREASNYLNNNIPKGSKLVILNVDSEFPALSEYIIDELISNTVNDRIFTVVDRTNIALIQQETSFQMSGEVSDETAVSIGQMLGAQVIISGAVSQIGDMYRLRLRSLDVTTAQIIGQFNRNIGNGQTTMAVLVNRNTNGSTSQAQQGQNQNGQTFGSSSLQTRQANEQTFEDMWQYFGFPNIQTWENTDNGRVSSKKKGFFFYEENFTSTNLQAIETYWNSIPKTFYARRWGPEKKSDGEQFPNLRFQLYLDHNIYGDTNLVIALTYPDENGKGESKELVGIVPGRVMEITQTMLERVK